MQDYSLRPQSFYRKTSGILTISGQRVSARIRHGALEVTSGWPLEGSQETHRLSRATHRIERLVCLAGSGWLSLAVLDWLRENNIPFVGLGQDGAVRWVTLPGPGGAWQAKLRMAQALAPWSPVGLHTASWLVAEKTRRHASLLHTYAPRLARVGATSAAAAAEMLLQSVPRIERAESLQRIRRIESELAEVAWSGLSGLVVGLRPPSFAKTVPPHVLQFATRHSPLSGGPQHAISIPNALINLTHALVIAECAIAAHGAGLDTHLPLIHALRDARPSMLLDLAEPSYPVAEGLVIYLLLTHEFRRGEFYVLRNGMVRLDQDFVAELLPRWIPPIRQSVAPIVERVASMLRRARIRPQDHPAHRFPRQESTGVCPECGSPVRPGRRFCSHACYAVWWKAHVQPRISQEGNDTLARLREDGRDPSHGGEAARKRAAATSRIKRREWMTLSPEERHRRTAPATRARWARKDAPTD